MNFRHELLGLAALAVLVVAINVAPITNNDIFLHLTTGRLILETGSIPRVDDYSALARGRPYVAHEWLAAVVFHLVERAAGIDGLIVFKVVVAIVVAGFLYAAARTLGASPELALPALAFAMVLAAARFLERPHIFTFVLTAAFLWLLSRRRTERWAPRWAFLPLQCLWVNLHGAFLLGPGVVALAALAEAIEGAARRLAGGAAGALAPGRLREARHLGVLAGVLLATCLVNPYGPRLLAFPFELTSSRFTAQIYEWLPPLSSSFRFTYMARGYVAWIVVGSTALLVALGFALARREAPPGGAFPLLLFAAFLVLSLRMNRNVTDFALATLPGVVANASWLTPWYGRPSRNRWVAPSLAAGLLALAGWFAVAGYTYSPTSRRPIGFGLGDQIPVAAADFLERSGIRGNAFNSYDSGAYLTYRFYPAVRVGMDSRNDVYGEDLYALYERSLVDPASLRALLARIEASFVLLAWPRQTATAGLLRRDFPGWRLVYFDDYTSVYVTEDGPWAALARGSGYRILDPAFYQPGGARQWDPQQALAEAERAVEESGGAEIARVMRVEALLAAGREGEARAEESRLLSGEAGMARTYVHLGELRLERGDRAEAGSIFRRALERFPESAAARRGLDRAQGS